jgi:branched-chain amino acid transport system substrate-binding protein
MSIPLSASRARRVVTVLAAVSLGALALAGCSGGLATQSKQTKGPSSCPAEVQIGAPLPLSGPLADFGNNSLNGMKIAAKEINAAGGMKSLGGSKIKIVAGDTTSGDAGTATSATSKLIEDGASGLIGAWLSNMTTTVSTIAEQAKVPILTQSWADSLSQRKYQYYFQAPPKSSAIGAAATSYMMDSAASVGVHFTKVAGVGPNDVANTTQINAAVAAFKSAGVAADEPTFYQAGITDATPIVTRLVAQNADLILLSGSPADASLIVKALRARGVTTPIMGFGGAFVVPSFAKVMGSQVEGLLAVGAWNWDLPLPGVKAAAKEYKQEHGEFMPMEAGESWNDVYLLVAAMEKAKSCDPGKIAQALHSLDATSGPASAMPGGTVSFDADGTNPHAIPILTQWRNGETVTVWPKKYATSAIELNK